MSETGPPTEDATVATPHEHKVRYLSVAGRSGNM